MVETGDLYLHVVFPVFDVAYRFQKIADVLIRMTKNIGIHGIADIEVYYL